MNGINALLDTNIIIGLVKGNPAVLAVMGNRRTDESGYSAITRMELLGFPGLLETEKAVIGSLLAEMRYFPITQEIEDATISLRQKRRIKLPDAIIAATAQVFGLELLTLDEGLRRIFDA
ncbi:type II toxin-antitoxin system VapC family toxin [Methylomagnum sp.]